MYLTNKREWTTGNEAKEPYIGDRASKPGNAIHNIFGESEDKHYILGFRNHINGVYREPKMQVRMGISDFWV